MNAHAKELMASRRYSGDERKVVTIQDGGHRGADIYWAEPIGNWVIVKLEPSPQLTIAEDIALVRLHEDADPDTLERVALASDFEGEKAVFVIDAARLSELTAYGPAIEVLWASTPKARRAGLVRAS
jgi:hypothetical protein